MLDVSFRWTSSISDGSTCSYSLKSGIRNGCCIRISDGLGFQVGFGLQGLSGFMVLNSFCSLCYMVLKIDSYTNVGFQDSYLGWAGVRVRFL